MNKTKLFCFPYAGGSAYVYNRWKFHLDEGIELRPIEFAGRGARINEPLYKNLEELVEDVFQQIKPEISYNRYALFGHSLGALTCYQLIEKIKENGLPEPIHVFFSGRGVPHIPRTTKKDYHLMDYEEFKEEVIKLGGTPKEFFENSELTELFLPVLKNDFRMVDTFQFTGEVCRYNGNITVFLGKDDKETAEQYLGWKDYTTKTCQIIYFNGGHFFIHDEMENMARFMNQTLSAQLNPVHPRRK